MKLKNSAWQKENAVCADDQVVIKTSSFAKTNKKCCSDTRNTKKKTGELSGERIERRLIEWLSKNQDSGKNLQSEAGMTEKRARASFPSSGSHSGGFPSGLPACRRHQVINPSSFPYPASLSPPLITATFCFPLLRPEVSSGCASL